MAKTSILFDKSLRHCSALYLTSSFQNSRPSWTNSELNIACRVALHGTHCNPANVRSSRKKASVSVHVRAPKREPRSVLWMKKEALVTDILLGAKLNEAYGPRPKRWSYTYSPTFCPKISLRRQTTKEKVIFASLNFGPSPLFLIKLWNRSTSLLELPKPIAGPPWAGLRAVLLFFYVYFNWIFEKS